MPNGLTSASTPVELDERKAERIPIVTKFPHACLFLLNMKWQDVTVQQFQQLTDLRQDALTRDPAFLVFDMVGIFYNMSPTQVDSLSVDELNKLSAELSFLQDMPDWKPERFVEVDGRHYRFVYDVRQIHAARNIEVKHFANGDFISNLHTMAASMVIPQRLRKSGLWKDDKYDAAKHQQYADDMRQAPITSIYGSAVFFCKVFQKLIPSITDYLVSSLPMEMREQARQSLLSSCEILDGSTTPSVLPNLSVSPWTGLMNSPTSNSLTT